jgi:hypothetical protein
VRLCYPKVVERVADVLKLFNDRTKTLVLGAGAMQVAKLKSITAKHLVRKRHGQAPGWLFITKCICATVY